MIFKIVQKENMRFNQWDRMDKNPWFNKILNNKNINNSKKQTIIFVILKATKIKKWWSSRWLK
jgi:hypothetical protein